MSPVEYPAALVFATWDRATAALSGKAKPAVLADALKQLRRLYDAVEFAAFDLGKLSTLKDAQARDEAIDAIIERRIKPLETQARAAVAAADKSLGDMKKTRPEPAAAVSATEAASKGAETLLRGLGTLVSSTKVQLARRIAELRAGESDKEDEDPKVSQHKMRLKTKVLEMLRIVKNRPDREVKFVVCVGNVNCYPYLGPVVGPR